MKWFSLLTVGLVSLCALTSAQDRAIKSHPCTPTNNIFVDFTPTADVPLTVGQILPLGSVVTISEKEFALSSDGTMIKIKKEGSYSYDFFLNTFLGSRPLNTPLTNISIEFSTNGQNNWKVLNVLFFFPNFASSTVELPLSLSEEGYIRLRVTQLSDPSMVLPAGSSDVRVSITKLNPKKD